MVGRPIHDVEMRRLTGCSPSGISGFRFPALMALDHTHILFCSVSQLALSRFTPFFASLCGNSIQEILAVHLVSPFPVYFGFGPEDRRPSFFVARQYRRLIGYPCLRALKAPESIPAGCHTAQPCSILCHLCP